MRRRAQTLAQLGRPDHLDIRRQCEQRGHGDVGTVEDQRLAHPAVGVRGLVSGHPRSQRPQCVAVALRTRSESHHGGKCREAVGVCALPFAPEPRQVEAVGTPRRLVTCAGVRDAIDAVHAWRAAMGRDQVPVARLVHQTERMHRPLHQHAVAAPVVQT
jgi:hypothetical protein